MTYRLRPQAKSDIEAVVFYIAQDNPWAARRWHEQIFRCCQRIGAMPGMGVARSEVRPGIRSFALGNYLIL
ncbi:hypothetical protein STVA_27200 [Allostella vacuolata]|nr:hypothetical protein STVA_27200 [Stella vacuolata]